MNFVRIVIRRRGVVSQEKVYVQSDSFVVLFKLCSADLWSSAVDFRVFRKPISFIAKLVHEI